LVPTGRDALEIGCATGQHLATLRDRGGWRVTGVELAVSAAPCIPVAYKRLCSDEW
ncbi:MAG: class I SAM-dependent methyltransferase, partial [Armatimonadetes bacterium]|nr:class I SAM-dependent methyltransferase [Armatimonadota bacterium]